MRSRCKLGQSLVEVIVSVGIAVILAIALISAGLISNKTARSARNNTEATKLAEQYIEQIRVFRDRRGYTSAFTSISNDTCYILQIPNSNDPSTWSLITSGCPETFLSGAVNYSRSLLFKDGASANTKLVTATITWQDSGGTQTVSSQTILSLWSVP